MGWVRTISSELEVSLLMVFELGVLSTMGAARTEVVRAMMDAMIEVFIVMLVIWGWFEIELIMQRLTQGGNGKTKGDSGKDVVEVVVVIV